MLKKLKILMIAPTPFFADRGCHMQIYEQARALQKRGHEVRIITYNIGRDLPDVVIRRIPNVAPWYRKLTAGPSLTKIYLDFFLIFKTLSEAQKWEPDILHGHLHEGCFIGWIVSRCTGIPFVFDMQGGLTGELTVHEFISKNGVFYGFFRVIEKWLNGLAPAIFTHSTSRARELIESFGVSAEKITTIFDGTNLDLFRQFSKNSKLFEKYKIPKDKILIVYLGRLEPYQGVDLLIKSIPLVVKKNHGVHFLMFGYPDEEKYKNMAEKLGVGNFVTFSGRIDYEKAGEHISLGDIAITLKLDVEDNGKLYNYMACGLPVIALDNFVNREVVGEFGFYVSESTPEAVSSIILEAVSTPKEILRKMGEGGKKRIEENFTWDKCAERMEKVYESLAI